MYVRCILFLSTLVVFKNGKTILMAAVESGNKELVEIFLETTDVNVKEKVL